jgi:hypothetical protein
LLVVVADDLVYDVFPVAVDIAVKKASIVQGFGGWEVRRATIDRYHLRECVSPSSFSSTGTRLASPFQFAFEVNSEA